MRTVLWRTARYASLTLVTAGVVGSAAPHAVPAFAASSARHEHSRSATHRGAELQTQIGDAVKYVRAADGSARRVR